MRAQKQPRRRAVLRLLGPAAIAIGCCAGLAAAQNPPAGPEAEHRRLLDLQRREPAPALNASRGGAPLLGVVAEDVTFKSKTLGRSMKYRILLPASYHRSHRYYPVLYLLHGYMNPFYDWDKQTSLARILDREGYELVVVLPQFDNSFYVNAVLNPKEAYMSYFFRDLIPEVEKAYRVRSEPPARAIGGVSMGGYGAVMWGLRAPRAFSFVASFGGAIGLVGSRAEYAEALAPFDLEKVLGGAADSTARAALDPMQLLESVDAALAPPFWLQCGTEDGVSEDHLAFARRAIEKNIRLTLHLTPGGHEWATWDAALPGMLVEMSKALGVERDLGARGAERY